ncbi:hypothetical protein AVEN_59740-1 [Araneus ventricosus]|uniref:Uncharacterized protein n=1 Tax=Araneus ventricosus TaxID=182803 RepID=A0A4Y2BNB5_ARAVE|nr:hypothetical protein AVEN_59740-1 [Araneus ventricosus]
MSTTPKLAHTLQTSAPHHWEDVWAPTYDLTCNRPTNPLWNQSNGWIFSGIGFRTWNPLAPEAEILPLGHRCPKFWAKSVSNIQVVQPGNEFGIL